MAARPILAVGAVVVNDDALLMVRRGSDPHRGLWTIPGGRVEAGELLIDAVKREAREETGLEIEVGDLLGIFEVPGYTHYVIHDYIARVQGDPAPRAGGDAAEARWVPLKDLDRLECTPRLQEMLRAWGVLPAT